jgi:hypothetical protein
MGRHVQKYERLGNSIAERRSSIEGIQRFGFGHFHDGRSQVKTTLISG